jgi:membrane protein YqaA with SNARE-associated domain
MYNWIKRLHIRNLKYASNKQGTLILLISSFADASLLPLPVTTFFILLTLLNNSKAWKYALYITIGTLAGSLAGYIIGHYVWYNSNGEFTGFARLLFNNVPGFSEVVYNKFGILYAKWNFLILFAAAATPIPFGIFSVSSGVFGINIFIFSFAIIISQGIKFCLFALVVVKSIPIVERLKKINWKPVVIITSVSVIIVFVVIRIILNLSYYYLT